MSRRARRSIPATPEGRLRQLVSELQARPDAWRSFRSDDSGPLKIVRGTISLTGGVFSISYGGGFTGVRNGIGDATVTFTTPFSDYPTVTCTPHANSNRACSVIAVSTSSARMEMFACTNGALVDETWNFTAIGPA